MPYFAAQLQTRKKFFKGRLSAWKKVSAGQNQEILAGTAQCNSSVSSVTVSAAGQSSQSSKLGRKACGEPVKKLLGQESH